MRFRTAAAAAGSMLPAGLSPAQLAALSTYNAAQFAQPQSFTAWMNANPNIVYWGLGLLVVFAFLSEGRR